VQGWPKSLVLGGKKYHSVGEQNRLKHCNDNKTFSGTLCIFVLVLIGESIKVARFINPKVGTNQPGCRVSREGGLQGWWRRKEGTNSNERLVKSFEHNTSPLFQIP